MIKKVELKKREIRHMGETYKKKNNNKRLKGNAGRGLLSSFPGGGSSGIWDKGERAGNTASVHTLPIC